MALPCVQAEDAPVAPATPLSVFEQIQALTQPDSFQFESPTSSGSVFGIFSDSRQYPRLVEEVFEPRVTSSYDLVLGRKRYSQSPLDRVHTLQKPLGYWEWNDEILDMVGPDVLGLSSSKIEARAQACYRELTGEVLSLSGYPPWATMLATDLVDRWLFSQVDRPRRGAFWEMIVVKESHWMSDILYSVLRDEDREMGFQLMLELETFD